MAEEREERRRRVNWCPWVAGGWGDEAAGSFRFETDGGVEGVNGDRIAGEGGKISGGSSSLRTSKISRSLIGSLQLTHLGTLFKFF